MFSTSLSKQDKFLKPPADDSPLNLLRFCSRE